MNAIQYNYIGLFYPKSKRSRWYESIRWSKPQEKRYYSIVFESNNYNSLRNLTKWSWYLIRIKYKRWLLRR